MADNTITGTLVIESAANGTLYYSDGKNGGKSLGTAFASSKTQWTVKDGTGSPAEFITYSTCKYEITSITIWLRYVDGNITKQTVSIGIGRQKNNKGETTGFLYPISSLTKKLDSTKFDDYSVSNTGFIMAYGDDRWQRLMNKEIGVQGYFTDGTTAWACNKISIRLKYTYSITNRPPPKVTLTPTMLPWDEDDPNSQREASIKIVIQDPNNEINKAKRLSFTARFVSLYEDYYNSYADDEEIPDEEVPYDDGWGDPDAEAQISPDSWDAENYTLYQKQSCPLDYGLGVQIRVIDVGTQGDEYSSAPAYSPILWHNVDIARPSISGNVKGTELTIQLNTPEVHGSSDNDLRYDVYYVLSEEEKEMIRNDLVQTGQIESADTDDIAELEIINRAYDEYALLDSFDNVAEDSAQSLVIDEGTQIELHGAADTRQFQIYVVAAWRPGGYSSAYSNIIAFTYVNSYTVRHWDGSNWVDCTVNYWDGSQWVECIPYIWDGSTWTECSF